MATSMHSPPPVETLRSALRGEIIARGDSGYEQARRVYNAMIDRSPAIIARCADAADVIASVNTAREHGLTIAVRGGGHNGAGLGTVDDGLVIDLSPMRGIRVDPRARTAQVQGGATLGDVDHATHAFGLAVPTGIASTTGIGGLTLGGGLGHLTRRCGLTIDNLLEVDIVLADGRFITANAEQYDDLFWAVRGGGGNFGVVTSFTFQLHPVSQVTAGPILYELEHAAEVMRWYREFISSAPRDLSGFFAFLTVPPVPEFPPALQLKKMCGVVWCYAGPLEHASATYRPVLDFMAPALNGIATMEFPAWQSALDGLYPPGDQWYWRGDFVSEITDDAIARHVEHGATLPTWQSNMHLYPIDGASGEVANDATAWAYRDARWAEVIIGVDPDPTKAGLLKRWTTDYWNALHPYSAGGAYVNFMMDEGQERVQATYRGNYPRLAAIKKKYDPHNFFHINQNIKPSV